MPCLPRTALQLRERRHLSRCPVGKGKGGKKALAKKRRSRRVADNCPAIREPSNQAPPIPPSVQQARSHTMGETPAFSFELAPLHEGPEVRQAYPPVDQLYAPLRPYPTGIMSHVQDRGFGGEVPPQAPLSSYVDPSSHFNRFPVLLSSTTAHYQAPSPLLSLMDDTSNMSLTPVPGPPTALYPPSPISVAGHSLGSPLPIYDLARQRIMQPGPSSQVNHAPSPRTSYRDKGKWRAVEYQSTSGGTTPRPYVHGNFLDAKQRVRAAAEDAYRALDSFISTLNDQL